MSFSPVFCRFLAESRFEDLSRQDVETARRAFLDGTAVSLAGTVSEAGDHIVRYVRGLAAAGPARVIGTGVRTHPALAALANGVLAHSLDFDDVNHPMMGHPTAVLLPAIFAVADLRPTSGREAIAAYALGLELAARIGRVVNPWHYEQGWHATSTLGTLAAAVAAARLLGLDPEQAGTALSLAATQASGLRGNFGYMAKPYHAGHAARCGVEAALLAGQGFTAAHEVLEGEMGLFSLFGNRPSRARVRQAVQGLGKPFELTASGLTVKRYPCCAGSHPAVDAVLALRNGKPEEKAQPEGVLVRVHPLLPRMMIHDRPSSPLEAKFSLRFCLGAALADGKLDLASFSPASLVRRSVLSCMDRIEIRPDLDRVGSQRQIPTRAEVVFVWPDGSTKKRVVARPLGSPDKPLGEAAMREKFGGCAGQCLPRGRVEPLLSLLERLEGVEDLRLVTRLLTTVPRREGKRKPAACLPVGKDGGNRRR